MLFVVPTPIGNLEDMTFRAIRVLKEADLILAEDTRTSGILLKHFSIETPLQAFHMHNEHKVLDRFATMLQDGANLALISDAGTPAISDPGFLLVREAVNRGVEVQCLPGATAFVPALVNSGIPVNDFSFHSFLPPKKGRKTKMDQLMELTNTFAFYESPHKLVRTLSELAERDPDRPASISREISKKFEETVRGTLLELKQYFETHPPKGEFVVVIGGK
ncbi:MAG: 16S rRNA (cytidine(1402)-2'-O)-methyltransferase [Bacteroidota bacterium]|nr:16S rRNA (cytidine(1402)-2'-O)-methyltransferase [Bacteroidota bacterium]MDX5447575.1 16S rRNA (cytidine(1402)-2'-O)-methyltransferase [Bacteroidota bacterium]